MTKKEEKELKYLRYFYEVADFGPADWDVRRIINMGYEELGGKVPDEYREEP